MTGLGTIINVALIVAGGILGMLFGKKITERFRTSLIDASGVAVIVLGLYGAIDGMIKTGDTSMMMIISIVLGTLIGELLKIDQGIEKFGEWLKVKTKSEGDKGFVNAFVTASCTVCIGAMAIVGAIKDGIEGDISVLVAKGILDFIIIMIMAASLGKGAAFSAIPVAVLQGSVTALSTLIQPIMTDLALSYISLTGSILIACVGINLVFDKKLKVANMLPALIIAVAWALVKGA